MYVYYEVVPHSFISSIPTLLRLKETRPDRRDGNASQSRTNFFSSLFMAEQVDIDSIIDRLLEGTLTLI
jgi:hypothetical protein